VVQRTIVIVEDDLDGSEAVEAVRITIQGVQYELDLSERNFAKLQKALDPYLSVARRVGGSRNGAIRARSTDVVVGDVLIGDADVDDSDVGEVAVDNAAVRAWAGSNGIRVSGRGRISRAVIAQFRAAGN
jgi:hypothetical protein